MTDGLTGGLTVAPNERNVLRVFALDISGDEASRLRDAPDRDRALGALLGVERIDPDRVEILNADDLAGVGLAGYLVDGQGAAEAQIAADRSRLDAVHGYLMIVRPGAFGAAATTLHPIAAARLVGNYSEDVPVVRFEPLPDAGAKETVSAPPPVTPAKLPGGMGKGVYIAMAMVAVVILLALLSRLAG